MHSKSNNVSELLALYDISKRTFYYDLEEINNLIYKFGKLKINENTVYFEGDLISLTNNLENLVLKPYYKAQERQNLILFSILEEENKSLDDFMEDFQVSKTTVFSDIEAIRADLNYDNTELLYKNNYFLQGNEWKIRDLYLTLLILKPFSYKQIRKDVRDFNLENELLLSDYSMFYLSHFINYIQKRIDTGNYLDAKTSKIFDEINVEFSTDLSSLLKTDKKTELNYMKSYVMSLSGMKDSNRTSIIKNYVDILLTKVEHQFALTINWDESFRTSLQNHLLSSYYRIEFSFPALNPSLNDIKMKHFNLYHGIKQTIKKIDGFNEFSKMRDEEIGFVTAYIGGYLIRNKDFPVRRKKIVIVCPQGRAVSNNLKYQIQNVLPDVDIVASFSIDQIGNMYSDYDYIISTVELPHLYNVIKVNPILSEVDRFNLKEIFYQNNKIEEKYLQELYAIIAENAKVIDEDNLRKNLRKYIVESKNNWRDQPMLKDLLPEKRIKKVTSVSDWKQAIQVASQPLLEDGSIEESYINAMIESVEKFGPYIVLADEFALPHASSSGGVNKLSMSMLILDEKVDLLGEDVKIFLVLAAIDNKSHLKALASLTEILSKDGNLEFIKNASVEEISKLIQKEEVNKWKF